tara:strand:- start:293 stop:505 length:213 start_codon:yes stop_codon:yes gene_type:complete
MIMAPTLAMGGDITIVIIGDGILVGTIGVSVFGSLTTTIHGSILIAIMVAITSDSIIMDTIVTEVVLIHT